MISVVSPVYNSEKTIKKFILTLVKYLKKIRQKYEIVLINDNSKDNSKNIIKKIKKKNIYIEPPPHSQILKNSKYHLKKSITDPNKTMYED